MPRPRLWTITPVPKGRDRIQCYTGTDDQVSQRSIFQKDHCFVGLCSIDSRFQGFKFDITDSGIRFWHPGGDLKPVAIETDVHPGFMTDWQQPLVVALTQAKGLSIVHETVYENRFGFTKPLVQMGATVQLYRECLGSLPCRFQQRNYKHSAVIFGPTPLTGRDIDVPDLRGGFSHLIAALAAKGPSDVHGISLIDRGYADFRGKLEALGANFD